MIRCMAAVDSKLGIADEHGVPWQGKLPTDIRYLHDMIRGHDTIMGYGFYKELKKPFVNPTNYVATRSGKKLRDGFIAVADAHKFLETFPRDIWNLGGAILFASTIDLADELYLTRVEGDFHCTKFFPAFEDQFVLQSSTEPQSENGITFHFEIWRRK